MTPASIIEAIKMPQEFLPPADAVYEVSATPFQAVGIGMLFLETSMKLSRAKEMAESGYDGGGKFTEGEISEAAEFLTLYGDSSTLAIGTDAIARLAMPPSRLTMVELSLIASVCQIGTLLMKNTDDWSEFVASWFRGVRQQILDDHAVRSEVQQ